MSTMQFRNLHRIGARCFGNCLHQTSKNYVPTFNLTSVLPSNHLMRLKATDVSQNSPKKSILKNILEKMRWVYQTNLKRSAYLLYGSVADELNYLQFFKDFNMEDTLFSWFLITELHVWMLLVRVMAEDADGKFLRNSLIEAMWDDVSTRAKKLEVSSTIIQKQMNELSEQFQAAIIGYDEGLLSDDRVLAGALWRRFFKQECSNPEQIECLVRYVRNQIKLLDDLSREKLLSHSITWIPLQNSNQPE